MNPIPDARPAAIFRKALFSSLIALGMVTSLPAKEFHVATGGDDADPGTETAPFASIQRAAREVNPGDTVFIHGGAYRMSESGISRVRRGRAHVILLDRSGARGKPISYLAWRDEKPVFDFSEVKPRGCRVTAFQIEGSWLHLKGLSVTGVQVTITGHTQSICFDNEGSHNIYEQLEMHDGQAIGFWLGNGSDNLVLNCDAWRNHDHTSENRRGGNVDGFGFHVRKGSTGNVFRGCRAWLNSDDGFDLINTEESLVIENCWSFYNGFSPDFKALGDGNGFKLGGYGIDGAPHPDPLPRHVIRQSVAARNRASGFYANHQPAGIELTNNTAYLNRVDFNLLGRDAAGVRDVPGYGHVLKNNLSYKGNSAIANVDREKCELIANSFDAGLAFDDADFESLEMSGLTKPRQSGGDLPEVSFMHLLRGNPAIDKGVKTGLPFNGKAPDMGAFESDFRK